MKHIALGLLCLLCGLLAGAEFPRICPTAGYLTPETGHIRIKIRPQWEMSSGKFQCCPIFKSRQERPGQATGRNVTWGVNRHVDGKTYIWFYFTHPDTGRDWGNYLPYELKNGQVYEFHLGWEQKHFYLTHQGKTLMKRFLPFPVAVGRTYRLGPVGKAAAWVEVLSAQVEPIKIPPVVLKTDRPAARLKLWRDTPEELSLELENPAAPLTLTVTPEKFPIRRGQRYFVNHVAPELPPFEVTATQNGCLTLKLPAMLRTALTISVTSGNWLKNGAFAANLQHWQSEPSTATTGVKWLPTGGRNGSPGVLLKKDASSRDVALISAKIPVQAGQTYYASGFYHWVQHDLDSGLALFIRLIAGDRILAENNNRYTLSFPNYATVPGEWRYTFHTLTVPAAYRGKKLAIQVGVRLDGNVGTVLWDDMDLRVLPRQIKLLGKKLPEKVSPLPLPQLQKKQNSRSNLHFEFAAKRQDSGVKLDGQIAPWVPYFAQSPYAAALAMKSGIKILRVSVRVNNWCRVKGSIWRGCNEYDWSVLERKLTEILAAAPDAKLILDCFGNCYHDFAKAHPQSAWVSSKGERNLRFFNTMPELAYSFISDEVLREKGEFLYQFGRYLAHSPWGKSVLGIHLGGGSDGQWYPPERPWDFKTLDYSEGSRLAVVAELRNQYHNNERALQKAWGQPDLTFETIQMPTAAQLRPSHMLLDPQRDRYIIDTVQAYHRALVKGIDRMAGDFKRGFGRPVLFTTFAPGNSLMAQDELCRTKYLDGIVSLPYYMRDRDVGGNPFTADQPVGSFLLHGKRYLSEVDFRNEYSEIANLSVRRWLGVAPGVAGHFAQLRRTYGTLFASGVSGWLMTIGQTGHFIWTGPFEPIVREIAQAAQLTTSPDRVDVPLQVAVFRENYHPAFISNWGRLDHHLTYNKGNWQLAYSGLKYQTYLLSDLTHPRRPAAKINFFPAAATLNEAQIQWIEKNLQKDGNVLIFSGDAGRVGGVELPTALRRLTGMNIVPRITEKVGYNIAGNPHFDLTTASEARRQPFQPGNTVWAQYFQGPRYDVVDPQVEVVAYHPGNEQCSVAVKRHANWVAVYIAGSNERALPVALWRYLASLAQIQPYGPAGDLTALGHGIAMIHAAAPGIKNVAWQVPADVLDLTTGKYVARGVKELTLTLKFGETRWFFLKKSK